jgi:hypothetical protein
MTWGKMRHTNQMAIGKPTGKRPLGGTPKVQQIILKWILNEKYIRLWITVTWLWTTVIWFRMEC